jgi:hypothetical protein
MKVALCFWGICRSTDHTISSIERHIFQPLKDAGIEYDTYIHTYRLFRPYSNPRAGERALQLKNTLYKLLRPTNVSVENQDSVDHQLHLEQYRIMGNPWSNDDGDTFITLDNHIRSLWSLSQVTRLWKESGQTYDLVIYLRPDVWFLHSLTSQILSGIEKYTVRMPDFHLVHGCNDRFVIGRPEAMEIYGNRFQGALAYSKKSPLHSETYLAYTLQNAGIQIQNIRFRFQRVRADGSVADSDKTL